MVETNNKYHKQKCLREAAWLSGLGCWIWYLEVPGSNLPPCYYLDLFSVVSSSTPQLRYVNNKLVRLPPVGILKLYLLYKHQCFIRISATEKIHIFSHVKISIISLILTVSLIVLKFVGVSSKHLRIFLESLRESSEIFGNFRKFTENVQERSSGLRNNFGKSSEIFGNLVFTFDISLVRCAHSFDIDVNTRR